MGQLDHPSVRSSAVVTFTSIATSSLVSMGLSASRNAKVRYGDAERVKQFRHAVWKLDDMIPGRRFDKHIEDIFAKFLVRGAELEIPLEPDVKEEILAQQDKFKDWLDHNEKRAMFWPLLESAGKWMVERGLM